MTKLLLAGVILFMLSACDERVGRGIKAPTPMPLSIQTQKHENLPTSMQSEEVVMMNDVPILEDELPTLPAPTETKQHLVTDKDLQEISKIPTTSQGTKGFDIASIRISNSPERTRLVFDTYEGGTKASLVGHYSYRYDASKKNITLTLENYANISALANSKARTYAGNSRVKSISLVTQTNTTISCVIALRSDANVHVFDIKEPGRIVIDISPR